ncbi:uncharacterized protein [Physcomitrium patens]|uniref:uncharacterized protein isoform X2 n=1 Tax=Physcomitrium patens TaxID=3218 RepID=UPI0001622CAD|nr:uncharacterized protein LOC112280046 isoform X2 [Physcomitrium patens]|eukprot:XP_024370753.1 uncharacterized protein LOC112280046 isoform X2 [Physcomitrella patens]
MSQTRRTMFLPGPRRSSTTLSYMRRIGRVGCDVQHILVPFRALQRQFQVALSYCETISTQPVVLYTLCWTLLLAAIVTITALSLEMGFSASLSPSMEVVQQCSKDINKATLACQQCSRLPLDGPSDLLCVPANLFRKTRMDFAVPPIFAGLVVAASALFVQGMGLWDY